MPIDQSLIQEIDAKQRIIMENPDFYALRKKRVESEGTSISDLYSWWLEHPSERFRLLDSRNFDVRKKIYTEAKKGVSALKVAWEKIKSFSMPITENHLLALGAVIDPKNSNSINNRGWRDVRVSLGFDYSPPNYVKIPDLIGKVLRDLNEGEMHPVEKAAAAHLYIAGIQPFRDGNKRLARLVQNRILHEEYFLPAVIPTGERAVYIDLLEDALIGWRDSNLRIQRPFFDYIGGKVNVSLDAILDDLRKVGRRSKP